MSEQESSYILKTEQFPFAMLEILSLSTMPSQSNGSICALPQYTFAADQEEHKGQQWFGVRVSGVTAVDVDRNLIGKFITAALVDSPVKLKLRRPLFQLVGQVVRTIEQRPNSRINDSTTKDSIVEAYMGNGVWLRAAAAVSPKLQRYGGFVGLLHMAAATYEAFLYHPGLALQEFVDHDKIAKEINLELGQLWPQFNGIERGLTFRPRKVVARYRAAVDNLPEPKEPR